MWRLYLNTPMRRDAGGHVGDPVEVEVQFDAALRAEPVPPKLAQVLTQNRARFR